MLADNCPDNRRQLVKYSQCHRFISRIGYMISRFLDDHHVWKINSEKIFCIPCRSKNHFIALLIKPSNDGHKPGGMTNAPVERGHKNSFVLYYLQFVHS